MALTVVRHGVRCLVDDGRRRFNSEARPGLKCGAVQILFAMLSTFV